MTLNIHYENVDGMSGWCQDIGGPHDYVAAMESEMKGMGGSYAHPLAGLCTNSGKGNCSEIDTGTTSCLYMSGADQEDIDRIHSNVAMWGGAGHSVVHILRKGACIQVSGPKIANDAAWRADGSQWAKKHHLTIEDGPCGASWKKVVHQGGHGKMHMKIFMH